MTFLDTERAELEKFLPGLDDALASMGVDALEQDARPGLAAFKAAGGPGLLIPADIGGRGVPPVSAARIQRAVGSRSPALAVATTMHHFSIATMVEMTDGGLESILLQGIAAESLLVASGFSEGKPGQGVLSPTMSATKSPGGVVLKGVKRPCSLGYSMDLLTVSARVEGKLAVILVPALLPGLVRRPFWDSPALRGAESCEVELDDVEVPSRLVSYAAEEGNLDRTQIGAFLWFEVLICASYVGAASALLERALARRTPLPPDLLRALGRLEMAMAAVERVAESLGEGVREDRMLGHGLLVRYGVQEAVFEAAGIAAEAVGGIGFASAPTVALLLAAARALAFHPPSRTAMSTSLGDWLGGAALRIE